MNVVSSLDGSVYSQGIKIGHKAWLDIGSVEWRDTSSAQKAAAYQAAKICGWTDDGLKAIIISEFSDRIDQFMADVTIDTLREWAIEFPVAVTEVYPVKIDVPLFKARGSDKTFTLESPCQQDEN